MKIEEVLPGFRNGEKIRRTCWEKGTFLIRKNDEVHRCVTQGYAQGDSKTKLHVSFLDADDWEFYRGGKRRQ